MGQSRPANEAADHGFSQENRRAPLRDCSLSSYPELDCLRNLLPRHTLTAAAQRADVIGTGADHVLIAQGTIDEADYLRRFSVRSGIRLTAFENATRADIDLTADQMQLAAQTGMLRMQIDGKATIVATLRGDRARRLAQMAITSPREIGHLRLTAEAALQELLLYRMGGLVGHAIDGLHDRHPALSAAPGDPRRWVRAVMRRAAIACSVLSALAIAATFSGATGNLLAMIFLAAIALRLIASLCAGKPAAVRSFDDAELPDYSVIVALYREAASVPQLLDGLLALDYPREKLDIILVVETDDLATRAAIARARPPSCVRVIVAPDEGPRTKPKALNVALPFARGRYVAVYDAEDKPDPDQLRIALSAFRNGGDDLVCVQARLAIENSGDSFFTRMFAAEYAGQFDIVMPGYDRLKLPWPLGGTSNHFDARKLREVCAWDPFNVTEDADLGLRFARFRYRTATIDSTTWEEAPIAMWPWVKQRTRWMKGWMQTWWVHVRHPRRFWRRTGWRGMIARDLLIGGALLAALAYPFLVMVGALILGEYLVTGEIAQSAQFISPLHLASFVGGLGVSMTIQLRGLAHRGRLRHAWMLTLTPIYWGFLSFAAWRALLQLRADPYRWEKTEHGMTNAQSEFADFTRSQPGLSRARRAL